MNSRYFYVRDDEMDANDVTLDGQLSLKLFVVLTRALESVDKKVAKDIKSYDLNLSEFGVLEFLYHKGEQPIQIIGKKILLASSSITYVIDKLEQKKLLKRVACPKDRRVTYAKLTAEGEELMNGIFPQHIVAMEGIFAGLTTAEKETAIELLKKIGHHADSV